MSGLQFAQSIDNYRVNQGEATAKIGIIQANPEQSKHLETATMVLLGMSVDFVNLRKEAYADDSRIPEMVRHFE
jgi:tRNA nucleotidyltransferase (CCA-adding enzyme)